MNVEYQQITSRASPDDKRPWYDLSVSDGSVVIETDGDGGMDSDQSGESVTVDTSTDSVVAVSSDGELINYATGEIQDLRAHLAWYDAETDTLTLLEFVESE